jgi:hypothetical protein
LNKNEEKSGDENGEVNISAKRMKLLKGALKSLLYQHNAQVISRQDIQIDDLSEKELSVYLELHQLLKPYFSSVKNRQWFIAAQVPFISFSNVLFEAAGYRNHMIKLYPRPSSGSLLASPLDTAMVYTLLFDFEGEKFSLVRKDGMEITTNPAAIKRKNDVFGSIFNLNQIASFCDSRKIEFIHRSMIRPDLVTCVLNRSYKKSIALSPQKIKVPKISNEDKEAQKKRLDTIQDDIKELNRELLLKKKSFDLQKMDKEIYDFKNPRNTMADTEERRAASIMIKEKKRARWDSFHDIGNLKTKIKAKRREQYLVRKVII